MIDARVLERQIWEARRYVISMDLTGEVPPVVQVDPDELFCSCGCGRPISENSKSTLARACQKREWITAARARERLLKAEVSCEVCGKASEVPRNKHLILDATVHLCSYCRRYGYRHVRCHCGGVIHKRDYPSTYSDSGSGPVECTKCRSIQRDATSAPNLRREVMS